MSFISRLKAAAQNQSAFVDIQKALYDNKNSKKHCKSAADKLIRNGVTTAEDGKQILRDASNLAHASAALVLGGIFCVIAD